MAKRQFQLTEQEIAWFGQAEQQTRDVYELKRLQAVRLYGTGSAIRTIMNIVQCGESSVRQWVQRYKQTGLSGLQSQWQGSNANKLTAEQRANLKERLHSNRPDQVIEPEVRLSQGQFWTVSDMQIVVQRWYGVTYRSEDSYRHLLHASGFSYQRTEQVYRSRPTDLTVSDFEAQLEKK
jgi:transposase